MWNLPRAGMKPMSTIKGGVVYHWATREALNVVFILKQIGGYILDSLTHLLNFWAVSALTPFLETAWCYSLWGSVQSLSCVQHFETLWTAANQTSLSIANTQKLLKLMPVELVMTSNHLILCHPLLLLPSIFPSIRVFSNESVLHIRWPKDWSFSFSIGPSNEYTRFISVRINRFDLLEVWRTPKSLLQHHTSKASVLQCSALFIVQLSHPYMTPGKTIASFD